LQPAFGGADASPCPARKAEIQASGEFQLMASSLVE
jgi:hypothetical protein